MKYHSWLGSTLSIIEIKIAYSEKIRENREKAYQRLNQNGKKLPQHPKHNSNIRKGKFH